MASPTSTALPSGVSQPWTAISAVDQGGLIAIMTGVGVGFIVVSLLIRTYARHTFSAYRLDDYTFLVASIFACCQAGVVFQEVHLGLGKSDDLLKPQNLGPLQKATFASDILYIFTIFLCKLSTCFLFVHLTPSRNHLLAIWTILGVSATWVITSIFLIAFRCHTSHPWTDNSTASCANLFARWQGIAAIDITSEAAIFGMSIFLVWGIQMPLKAKVIVVSAFACRLPTLVPIALRLSYLNTALTVANPFFSLSRAVSCTQVHIGYAVTATIIPYLKPFMTAYDVPAASAYYNVSGISLNKSGHSQYGSKEGSRARSAYVLDDMNGGEARLRPEEVAFEASCKGGKEGRTTVGREGEVRGSWDSGHSRKMIIKKGVEFSVVSERGAVG